MGSVEDVRFRSGSTIRGRVAFLLALVAVTGFAFAASPPLAVAQDAGSTFSGRIVDRDGDPVPSQRVELFGGIAAIHAVTGADGAFAFDAAPAIYQLRVSGGAFGAAPGPFPGPPPVELTNVPRSFSLWGASVDLTRDVEQDLTLPERYLDVTVRDASGAPVPGARVALAQLSPVPGSSPSETVTTRFELFPAANVSAIFSSSGFSDAAGAARLVLFPADDLALRVTPPPGSSLLATAVTLGSVRADGATTVTLTGEGSTFRGRVIDRDGDPVPSQRVEVDGALTSASVVTGATGAFSLLVPSGTYRVNVSGGSMPMPGPFPAPPPVEPAKVPSTYRLHGAAVDLTSDVEQDLTLPNLYLDVTVRDDGGEPLPGTRVAIAQESSMPNFPLSETVTTRFDLFPGANVFGVFSSFGVTDAAGQVRLVVFPGDDLALRVYPPSGSMLLPTTMTLGSVTADKTVAVTLTGDGSRFSGRVTDRDGDPVANQRVELIGGIGSISIATLADGGFSLLVPPARYRLNLGGGSGAIPPAPFPGPPPVEPLTNVPTSYSLSGASVDLAGDVEQDLTLPERYLDVTVRDASGAPVPGARVALTQASPVPGLPPSEAVTTRFDLFPGANVFAVFSSFGTTDAGGHARLVLFPADNLVVRVTPPPGSTAAPSAIELGSVSSDLSIAVPRDTTPPEIAPRVAGTEGDDGWYTSDVTVAWDVDDAETAVTSKTGCGSTTVSHDTRGTTLTCSATNAVGLSAERTITIKRDSTPPSVAPNVKGTLGSNGWYTSDVEIGWTVADDVSGASASACPATTVSTDTTGRTFTCSATNGAGLTAEASVTVNRDATPPAVEIVFARDPDYNGWYNRAVGYAARGNDATSGVASCSSGATYAEPDTATGSVGGSCTDNAGNTAEASARLKYDATPPTLTCSSDVTSLWPVTNQFVPVTLRVDVADAVSGPGGFTLAGVQTSEGTLREETAGFDVGTADTAGMLRAARLGRGDGRTYTLDYVGLDGAGNAATCAVVVVVPHDQRP